MKLFSYAMVYAVIVFLIYMVIKFFRFSYVHIKAYVMRRKLAKLAATEKKDD
jgi:hypothetical protein